MKKRGAKRAHAPKCVAVQVTIYVFASTCPAPVSVLINADSELL